MEIENIEKSKYNEANLNIQRLHFAWSNCHFHRSKGKYKEWMIELTKVWSELVQDINVERSDTPVKIKVEYYNHLKECAKALKTDNDGIKFVKIAQLHDFLRSIQDKVGKGGVYDDGTGEESD